MCGCMVGWGEGGVCAGVWWGGEREVCVQVCGEGEKVCT